jgi:hypothetical protein
LAQLTHEQAYALRFAANLLELFAAFKHQDNAGEGEVELDQIDPPPPARGSFM